MAKREPDLVSLEKPSNEVEAQAWLDLLDDEEVPYVVVRYTASVMPGVMAGRGPWGEIRVPADELERAQAVLRAFRESEVDDDELERQARNIVFRYGSRD